MPSKITQIKESLLPLHQDLKNHSLYARIRTLDDLILFMSHHIYSVWDFMNLLKTLQNHLTCTSIPWKPVLHPENARLINEIVLEEESDVIDGIITSHFSYYLDALTALAPAESARSFFIQVSKGVSYAELIALPEVPQGVRPFLTTTFDILNGPLVGTASAFAFGREGIIPTMFEQIVGQSEATKNPQLKKFMDYIHRHIELDGGTHSTLAEKMVENLIHTDADLQIAIHAAQRAIQARVALWNAISAQLS